MAGGTKLNGWAKVLVGLAVSLLAVAVAWGTVRNQVKTNSNTVEKKLDTAVFQMYLDQEKTANEKRDKTLERMEIKLDKALEK